ncbi:MAG TPA: hypothetical protein VNG31_02100, partial [Candidatus Baltobacteraceae bacterium]|nr:hypothetical protein [Candidatus Baltobacteraceae bacterium]
NSGKVNAVAVDPADPRKIYTASGRGTGLETYSSAGIYRTSDGGATWQPSVNGLTDASGLISSTIDTLWLDTAHPSVLLAGSEYDGIYRSTDAGASWRNVYRTTQVTQFTGTTRALYAATAAGILRSTDDGAHWRMSLAATASQQPTALQSAGGVTFAGMSDGSIYQLDAGRWTKTGTIPFDAHTGTDGSTPAVHQLAIDPLTPTTLYANTNDGRWDQDLHASTDGGKTWKKVTPVYNNYTYYQIGLGTQAIAFSQVHAHMLYVGLDGGMGYIDATGTARPDLYGAANLSVIDIRDIWTVANGKDDACWVASDQGLDYEPTCSAYTSRRNDRVVSSTLATGLARRFAISPNGQTIMVSLQDFDSHATYDGGKTWREYLGRKTSLYEDGFNEIQPANAKICYAFDEAYGFQVSTDGCHHYSNLSVRAQKLLPSRLMTTPMAFDPTNPKHLYLVSGAIVGAGFPPTPHAVFQTSNQGVTLQRLSWPVSDPGMIVIDPHDASHIVLGDLRGSQSSSLQVTFDGGKTWKTSAGVPVTGFWYAATISPVDGRTVLASSVDAANDVFVLRSTDGGKRFRKVATVTNAPLIRGRIDATQRTGPPAAFVYSPEREIRFNQDAAKGVPYAAITTLRGAYLSTDLGTTWRRIDTGLISHSFWGIRWNKGYLYLGSDGQGIVRSTSPLQ